MSENVGKYIISIDNGIGEILEVTTMSGGEDFYKVFFTNTNVTNYFSVNNNNKYRIAASKDQLEKAISIFKNSEELKEFESMQEKINFYKTSLRANDVMELVVHLSQLSKEDEIHSQIKKIYDKALDSLVEEVKFVFQVPADEAKSLLGIS